MRGQATHFHTTADLEFADILLTAANHPGALWTDAPEDNRANAVQNAHVGAAVALSRLNSAPTDRTSVPWRGIHIAHRAYR